MQELPGRLDPPLALLATPGAPRPELQALSMPLVGTGRACIECGHPMRRFETASQIIDECERHGYWFDPGELQKVLFALATKNER